MRRVKRYQWAKKTGNGEEQDREAWSLCSQDHSLCWKFLIFDRMDSIIDWQGGDIVDSGRKRERAEDDRSFVRIVNLVLVRFLFLAAVPCALSLSRCLIIVIGSLVGYYMQENESEKQEEGGLGFFFFCFHRLCAHLTCKQTGCCCTRAILLNGYLFFFFFRSLHKGTKKNACQGQSR